MAVGEFLSHLQCPIDGLAHEITKCQDGNLPMAGASPHIENSLLDAPFWREDAVYDFGAGIQVPQDETMYPMLETSEKMDEGEIGRLKFIQARCLGPTIGRIPLRLKDNTRNKCRTHRG